MTAQGVALGAGLLCVAAGACEDVSERLAALARGAAPPQRVAVVRAAFAQDGAPAAALPLRALGHGVVAVAVACVRDPAQARLVDEWTLPAAADGAPLLTAQGVPLPDYLSQRCGAPVSCLLLRGTQGERVTKAKNAKELTHGATQRLRAASRRRRGRRASSAVAGGAELRACADAGSYRVREQHTGARLLACRAATAFSTLRAR